MDVFEVGVKQSQIFRVGKKDYSLTFTLPIVAELEKTLGRSLKSPADWLRVTTSEVQAILQAGFTTHHKETAASIAEKIASALDPEQIENVIDAICAAACPRAMERIRVEIDKARERVKQGRPPLPNGQSAGEV